MKCSKCQAQLPDGARFCGACGTPVTQPVASAEPKLDFSAMQTLDPNLNQTTKVEGGRTLQPGEEFAKRYKITRLIGEGGMGNVYLAADSVSRRDVALKLVRADRLGGKDAVERLINEGVLSRDIRHPNVVAVYDVGEENGTPFFSMEYIQGRSLRAWNRDKLQGEAWSVAAAVAIIREVLAGLEVAHRAGVVHRDLKPENVMLTAEPTDTSVQLKLLDFGIARAPGTAGASTTALGSQGYMAPEQLTAPDTAQPSADLYSLSVMFYELLVGVVPLNYWQPPSGGRPDVPVAIDTLIQKGLSPNPRARPQSVQEYRVALDAALATKPANPQGVNTWAERPEVKEAIRAARELISSGLKTTPGVEPQKPQINTGPKATLPPLKAGSLWGYFMACVTQRYAAGNGRASRKEYWGFNLVALSLIVTAFILDVAVGNLYIDDYGNSYGEGPVIATIVWLGLLAPSVAVSSRRMHDLGYSGWFAAAVAIPGIGNIVAILMGLPAGSPGENAYGPDPLEAGATP